MAYELILSTDTLDMGRNKINNFVNNTGSGIWSGSTGIASIISLNYNNFAFGDYTFVQGKNNSGITGTYSFLAGGYNNYSRGSFNFIGPGNALEVRTNASNYSFLGTGRLNTIGFNGLSQYSSILNGKNNKIRSGNFSNILGGNGGTTSNIASTVVNGVVNNAIGPYATVVNGCSNFIYLTNNSQKNNTILNGYYNGIYGPSNGQYNTILNGYSSKIGSSRGSLAMGRNVGIFGKNYNFVFGNNVQAANNYEMSLGFNGRKVRINFGAVAPQVGGFLSSGSWNATGADYAEYFEWKDKNTNNENRAGFFVEIIDGEIQIANSQNVIGVVSKNPSFLADSHQDYWQNVYLKDEWGNILTVVYEKYQFTSKEPKHEKDKKIEIYFDQNDKTYLKFPNADDSFGKPTEGIYNKSEGIFIEKVEDCKLNPNYDSKIKYIPRKERSEWEKIGLVGKLRVRTSEQITGSMVDVDVNNGMAKNGNKYNVLKKIKDYDGNYGIVLILFK